jgi:hypothetical protein
MVMWLAAVAGWAVKAPILTDEHLFVVLAKNRASMSRRARG